MQLCIERFHLKNLHHVSWFRLMRAFAFLIFSIVSIVPFQQGHAQIIETSSRIELFDEMSSVDVTNQIHITQIVDKALNYSDIIQRYEGNQRGHKQKGGFINLGHEGRASWLLFYVTNTSNSEDWVLDLGGTFSGRAGFVETLFVRNETTQTTVVRYDDEETALSLLPESYDWGLIPLTLPIGKTSLIVSAIKMKPGTISTIKPILSKKSDSAQSTASPHFFKNSTIMFMVFISGMFISLAYLRSNVTYLWMSAYFGMQALIFLILTNGLNPSFWVNSTFLNITVFLSFASAVVINANFLKLRQDNDTHYRVSLGLCALFVILACVSSFVLEAQSFLFLVLVQYFIPSAGLVALSFMAFNKARYGYFGAFALCFAWLVQALGFAVSGLAILKVLGIPSFLVHAHLTALLPQAVLFAVASISKIKSVIAEERDEYIKRSETAINQAKDIQKREADDQAKLLRVIERERELMAGLRELEVHRAEEMRIAKEDADEANRAKSAFLAVVSHEVRTPMTGILGMVRLLLDSKLSEKQHEYVMAVQNSGESMMALLNDILDFEKIETGNLDLEHIDFNVHQLVNGVVTLMSGHAAEKGIELKAAIDQQVPRFVKGDPTRLRQVILNFVNNAIKFTDHGSVIVNVQKNDLSIPVGSEQEEPKVALYFGIEDTGIGISEEAQKTLFDPFAQADSSVTRKYGGTGLGLTICKKLIEAMASSIDLNSKTDMGSTFSFVLELDLGDSEAVSGGKYSGVLDVGSSDTRPLTILIVEDNEMNQRVLQGFLQPYNHRLIMVDNAEDAIEVCKQIYGVDGAAIRDDLATIVPADIETLDCVFMDMQLPGMNGTEATRVIRSYDINAFQTLPIIALTGNVLMEDVKSYYQTGMNGFLAKPIDYEELKKMLKKVGDGNLQAPEMPMADTVEFSESEEKLDGSQQEKIIESDAEFDTDVCGEGAKFHHDTDALNSGSASADLLDMTMLESLSDNLGKDQCLELMAGFMEKNEELVQLMQKLPSNDFSTFNAKSHELKGMAANFGLKALSMIAGRIEDAAQAENSEIIEVCISEIKTSYDLSKVALDEWLNDL